MDDNQIRKDLMRYRETRPDQDAINTFLHDGKYSNRELYGHVKNRTNVGLMRIEDARNKILEDGEENWKKNIPL